MADGTRMKSVKELARKSETRLTKLFDSVKRLEQRMEVRYKQLLKMLIDKADADKGNDQLGEASKPPEVTTPISSSNSKY